MFVFLLFFSSSTFSVFVLRHLFIVYFLFSVPIPILFDECYDFFLSFVARCFLEQVLYWNAQQKWTFSSKTTTATIVLPFQVQCYDWYDCSHDYNDHMWTSKRYKSIVDRWEFTEISILLDETIVPELFILVIQFPFVLLSTRHATLRHAIPRKFSHILWLFSITQIFSTI